MENIKENMENIKNTIINLRRHQDPLITDVLKNTDWYEYLYINGKKPFIDCRDENGNLYTVYPEMENDTLVNDVFVVYKFKKNDRNC